MKQFPNRCLLLFASAISSSPAWGQGSNIAPFTPATPAGSFTAGHCVQWGNLGSLVDAGGACGTSGGGITALTGDVTASGSGSQPATLATVNSNTGSFGSATMVPIISVNAKGLITAVTTATITAAGTGTVTSVGAAPFTTVSNPTTTPTFTLSTQAANAILAGPVSGGATAPTFRALVTADIPSLASLYDAAGAAASAVTAGRTYVSVLAYGADPTGAADSASAIRSALTANPAGTIFFPAQSNGTAAVYKVASTITVNLNQRLLGAGTGSVALNCTSTTTSCIVGTGTSTANAISGLQDLTVNGPGISNTNAIGVFMGGDPAGTIAPSGNFANGFSYRDVVINGFGKCVQWGNNTWANRFDNTVMIACTDDFYAPSGISNSGEDISVSNSTFANSGDAILDAQGLEWNIVNTEFDYDTGPVSIVGGALHVVNSRFEQQNGPVISVPSGTPEISFLNGVVLIQNSTGSEASAIDLHAGYMGLTLDNINAYSSHTIAEFANVSGTANGTFGRIANISAGNGFTNLVQSGIAQSKLAVDSGFGGNTPSSGGSSGLAGNVVMAAGNTTAATATFTSALSTHPNIAVSAVSDATYPISVSGIAALGTCAPVWTGSSGAWVMTVTCQNATGTTQPVEFAYSGSN